jgi:alpha-beta hydrolase superfamily lysophospholipase
VHGTLLVPAGRGKFPLALLIAGSGPMDRDGNSALLPGANNSLKLLAEGLADHGIASLRYDKRGIGKSASKTFNEAELRFETYVDDAAAWVEQLRRDSRFSTITVVGHSEGSLIGILAVQRSAADAFISVAGPARPAGQVLRTQLRPQLKPALWRASEQILGALESGRTIESVPPPLLALYRPSVQPYLISWFRYTPAREIARLSVPVMIVQGTTDIQVDVAEAKALLEAYPGASPVIVEGMNHVLKLVPANAIQQRVSYSNPSLPVVPKVMDEISKFVHAAPRRQRRAPEPGRRSVIR